MQPERNVLSVSGHETVRIPATRARLTVMIEGREKTSDAAQKNVAQQSTAVLEFLKRSRVDRLQAGALALNPIYETKQFRSSGGDGQSIGISGYLAQWTAAFEVDAERAGELADGTVQAGATRITSFEFTATEDALAAAQREALKAAALRAKEDARAAP